MRTVAMAGMETSSSVEETLITYALGSCLGISIYDPTARVGAMLHAMLPASSVDPAKAQANPFMFIDTGVPVMFKQCYTMGARKERMVVKVAGGAYTCANEEDDHFQIGRRNLVMLRRLLWKNGVLLQGEDVGGNGSRHMLLDIDSGTVRVRSRDNEIVL